jgi:uncharacterized protein (TIGR00730 family)
MKLAAAVFPLLALAAACASANTSSDPQAEQDIVGPKSLTLHLTESKCNEPGRFVTPGDIPTPADVALDAFCGEVFLHKAAPKGSIVIFGSSRLKDGTPEYESARTFASLWTKARQDLPILTGGGGGLMEAGNRGAKEAGGKSLGISTYFKDATDTLGPFVTDGYMMSDFETRERALLRYAKGVVVYTGGVGTGWEFFMTLSEVQTKKMNKVPIILVGSDVKTAVMPYLQFMKDKGTIAPEDIDLFTPVDKPEDAVSALLQALPAQ